MGYVVKEEYEQKQIQIFKEVLLKGTVDLTGNGRFDSPGHSALCGITNLMALKNHRIVSSKLVEG